MRRLILFFITSAALAFLLSPPAQGQEAGTLTGVVEDPSGAPIPGAHVKLTGKATAEVFKTTSDETGQFEFRNLPEGKYVLSAQAQGVEPIEMVVTMGAHPAAPMRIRMEIAELKEEVTVTASPLSTPSAQNNTDAIDIGQDFLLSLPIKYYQLFAAGRRRWRADRCSGYACLGHPAVLGEQKSLRGRVWPSRKRTH